MAAVMGRDELQPMLDLGVVLIGFAALMIAAGIRMLGEQVPVGGDCALPGGGVDWRGCLPKAIGSGLAVGFLTGLFGVGGGFLIIPALTIADLHLGDGPHVRRHGKGRKDRPTPLTRQTVAVLRAKPRGRPPVMPAQRSGGGPAPP